MRLITLVILVVIFTACNNSGSTTENVSSDKKSARTKADSLQDQVLDGHNVGMAKMEHINEIQKKIKSVLDSLSKLPENLQKQSGSYKLRLDSALTTLKVANESMMAWMDKFIVDSTFADADLRVKYLESEKARISAITDTMSSSLRRADSLLMRR